MRSEGRLGWRMAVMHSKETCGAGRAWINFHHECTKQTRQPFKITLQTFLPKRHQYALAESEPL